MVGPVDLVVAVHAGLSQQKRRRNIVGQTAFVLRQARVASLRVATLAQHRRAHAQHAWLRRAMWVMAVVAVLGNRRVFPKIGTAYLGMAVVAGCIDGAAGQQSFRRVAMRAVTAGACHLALPYRVGIGLHSLGTLLLVAVEADFGLRRCRKDRVSLDMHRMTIGTGDRVVVMRAAVPGEARVCLVAFRAISILVRDRRRRVKTESDDRRSFLASSNPSGMIAGRSMAGFTLQLAMPEGGIGILRHSVLGAKDCQDDLLIMTLETRIGTLAAVVRELRPVTSCLGIYDRGGGDGHEGHRQHRESTYSHFCEHQLCVQLVVLELTNTVYFPCIDTPTWSMAKLARLNAGGHQVAVRVLGCIEVAAVLDHVVRSEVADMA